MNADTRLAKAQSQAAQMRKMTELLIPLLVAAIILPLIGDVFLTITSPGPWAAELSTPVAVLIKLLTYAPALVAAYAVIQLRTVFAEYEAERFLSAKASTAFQNAGTWALGAVSLKMFVAPLAISLLGGAAFNWRFDPLDIALMAFAVFVLMIGGVLEAAAASLKAENDQIV
jgi:hypothetical protein